MIWRAASLVLMLAVILGAGSMAQAFQAAPLTASLAPIAQATPAAGILCSVRVPRLQVRSGPGTAFPMTGQLAQGTAIRAVAFVARGVPAGPWILVEQAPGAPVGFVSALAQNVLCQSAVAGLPPARIPATPRPAATRTPAPTATRAQVVALVPVAGDLSGSPNIRGRDPRNSGALVMIPGVGQSIADRALNRDGIIRFADGLVFGVDVFDDRVGTRTGAGIKEVQFDLYYFDENGDKVTVHEQTERFVPYCVFGDQNGACNVWRFSRANGLWPNGEPLTPATVFRADITIVPVRGDPALWLWSFRMD